MTAFNNLYKDFLFNKHILVAEKASDHPFEVEVSLAAIYNVSITEGAKLLHPDHLEFFKGKLRTNMTVPEPFYRGFPQSINNLTNLQIIFDQIYNYTVTYGEDEWDHDLHSIFETEEDLKRTVFKENCEIVEFKVVSDFKAIELIKQAVMDLLSSTRPLNEQQYELVKTYISTYGKPVRKIINKNTAIKLAIDLRAPYFADDLDLPDVIKLVEELIDKEYNIKPFGRYHRMFVTPKINKLNLNNKDRKFITNLIHRMFESSTRKDMKIEECFEKRKIWKGLLHHLHFKPRDMEEKLFVEAIRYSKENRSAYSGFERLMNNGEVGAATKYLYDCKGPGAVARNIDYILSRCSGYSDVESVVSTISRVNGIILLQLLFHYQFYSSKGTRTFKFIKHNKLVTHIETSKEEQNRKTILSEAMVNLMKRKICEALPQHYRNKLGKVYISKDMKKIGIPLQEAASSSGYGVMTKGSRLAIPEDKIVRFFTYWEKVDDIDLSMQAIDKDGTHVEEYSWQTIGRKGGYKGSGLYFSGDKTDGWDGGSEYFDLDLKWYKKKHPTVKYLLVCNNVFSCSSFMNCECTAGYMLRDKIQSGQIYEPKTVKSSFRITADSRFAYLFAIDLENDELVWLNVSLKENQNVAGRSKTLTALEPYIYATDVINVYDLFNMMATRLVYKQEEADVIISDDILPSIDENEKEVILAWDFEKMLKYMNR